MASSITGAERLPDGDYSVSHRAPPPVPSVAYHSTQPSSPPKPLHEPGRPATGETSVNASSVQSERRRRGSFSSFLRRSSSNNNPTQYSSHYQDGSGGDVPPVPSVPATRIAQAAAAAAESRNSNSEPHGRSSSITNNSGNRKVSGEGRTMLRKVSKAKQREEAERAEQERLARSRQPPPRLPSHNPLPGIATFGGESNNNNTSSSHTALPLPGKSSSTANNFSRPGNAFASMPSSAYKSSSSPAYAVRSANNASSSPEGKGNTNGEYVANSVARTESMTNRGRYSYASSINHVNVSSPRRVRRRKDPTPFK